jgi:allene oxide cyclase
MRPRYVQMGKETMRFLALLFATTSLTLVQLPAFAERHLQLLESGNDVVTDVGPSGDSPGDILSFNGVISTVSEKKPIGSDPGFCIRIEVGKSWQCSFTVILADGQISVQGPYADVGDSTMVIMGGTGRYLNAKGSVISHARGTTPETYLFTFDLD